MIKLDENGNVWKTREKHAKRKLLNLKGDLGTYSLYSRIILR